MKKKKGVTWAQICRQWNIPKRASRVEKCDEVWTRASRFLRPFYPHKHHPTMYIVFCFLKIHFEQNTQTHLPKHFHLRTVVKHPNSIYKKKGVKLALMLYFNSKRIRLKFIFKKGSHFLWHHQLISLVCKGRPQYYSRDAPLMKYSAHIYVLCSKFQNAFTAKPIYFCSDDAVQRNWKEE